MTTKRRKGAIWEYLDKAGVLENGSDEEIKAAKRAYRKQYFLEYKRQRRRKQREFTICFPRGTGEYGRVEQAARRHKMAISGFLRQAVLGYLDRRYIVPDKGQIARLELLLAECLNEVKAISSKRERLFWGREEKLEAIEKRIIRLEARIDEMFRNPPIYPGHDHQD